MSHRFARWPLGEPEDGGGDGRIGHVHGPAQGLADRTRGRRGYKTADWEKGVDDLSPSVIEGSKHFARFVCQGKRRDPHFVAICYCWTPQMSRTDGSGILLPPTKMEIEVCVWRFKADKCEVLLRER